MKKIIVSGIGVDVGKTVVSAILTTLFEGDYWKPVQCGEQGDSAIVRKLISHKHQVYPSAYTLKAPLSPHHAARLEKMFLKLDKIALPETKHTLIIESIGGILVPFTSDELSVDLFQKWEAKWIVVSRHYIGSINHTLLTLEALKKRGIDIWGIIFNGEPNIDSEEVILNISKIPFLARVLPEKRIDNKTVQRYANLWCTSLR